MRSLYRYSTAVLTACLLIVSSGCRVEFNGTYDANDTIDKIGSAAGSIADKFITPAEDNSLSGDITFINAADIELSDFGSSIYDLLPAGVFDNISVDSTAVVANVSTLAVLSQQENPSMLVDHTDIARTYADYALDANHIMCTDLETVLVDNHYLTNGLISTINDKYIGTVSNILASHDKSTFGEAWFVLDAVDKNDLNKKLYWRIGQGIDGKATAYFMCYPNCLITGELAYYLIALYSNGYSLIDYQAIINEYYSLLSKPETAAIYNKHSDKFSFTLE